MYIHTRKKKKTWFWNTNASIQHVSMPPEKHQQQRKKEGNTTKGKREYTTYKIFTRTCKSCKGKEEQNLLGEKERIMDGVWVCQGRHPNVRQQQQQQQQ